MNVQCFPVVTVLSSAHAWLCNLMFCPVQDEDKCLSAPHVHDTAPVLNPKPIIFCWCKGQPECSPLFHHSTVVCGEQAVRRVIIPPFRLFEFEMFRTHVGTNPKDHSVRQHKRRKKCVGDVLNFNMDVRALRVVIITRCERLSELGGRTRRLGGGWQEGSNLPCRLKFRHKTWRDKG